MVGAKGRRSLAFILSVSGLEDKAYGENPAAILDRVVFCPLCVRDAVNCVLAHNGHYQRWIPVGVGKVRSRIYRKRCARCRVSFSLLPDFVVRSHRYSRGLMASWLGWCLKGASSRCRAFFQEQGIAHPQPEPLTAWSDLLDAERTRPGYQLLCRWVRSFALRALRVLPTLLAACLFLGANLKQVAERLGGFRAVPPRAWPLVVALGLFWVLQEHQGTGSPPPWEHLLWDLVGYLTSRPLPPSHKLRRASGGRVIYDVLTIGHPASPLEDVPKEARP